VACPHFYPTQRSPHANTRNRYPLIDAYDGECRAGGAPDERTIRELCNFGYAAGTCPHAKDGADAIRIAYAGERLLYILERAHEPVRFGDVADAGEIVARQAEVYALGYRRRAARG
jgi:hypothetical protein